MCRVLVNVVKERIEWNSKLHVNRTLQLGFVYFPFLPVPEPRDVWMSVMEENRKSHQAIPNNKR